jgi:hypothetical protein
MLFLSTVVASFLVLVSADTFPTCGTCWCAPDNNGAGKCPDWSPQTTFSNATINTFNAQKPSSIYTLNCNPYKDSSCQTTPVQILTTSDTAVCAYNYPKLANSSNSCTEYSMMTYVNQQAAEVDGAILTHKGSCGLCSTTQDLAVYLSKIVYVTFIHR